ncbi:MAG: cytidylate kinase-like family protein [Balneolaceae bacterium]|nr:cytidylate kinase-like family protein [Balneolaceae bacterium]
MVKKVTEIVEKQISNWSRQNTLGEMPKKTNGKIIFPVITISREFGSPGAALAYYLGEKTGFDVWDKELLKAIAEELGSDQKLIETLDERRQLAIEDAVSAFLTNVKTNVNYLHSLIRVVRTIEEHGSGIIVGRGANYICDHPESLHVRLVAPLKYRIAHYASWKEISTAKAKELALRKDRERNEFIRQNFQKDVSNPIDYDLVINFEKFNMEQMAELVVSAYEIKTGKKLKLKMQT